MKRGLLKDKYINSINKNVGEYNSQLLCFGWIGESQHLLSFFFLMEYHIVCINWKTDLCHESESFVC
jgi:hypothetical protein